jgi:hypothetical protein
LVEQFVQHRLKPRKGKVLTPVTVNHGLRTLRRILHVAKEWKLVRDIPAIKVLPGEHQRDYVLTDAEVKKMTAYLGAKYPESVMRHALPFLVDTGLWTRGCGYPSCAPSKLRMYSGRASHGRSRS